jgi:two-component sensor histidine kinase
MSADNTTETPLVEANPTGDVPDTGLRALRYRIRQQELLAEMGVIALQGATFDELLGETARLTAIGLDVEFCKILEHIPATNRLLVRAGVGWDAGVVGVASVGADLESPAGFALRTGKPVISNHLENEERFRTSDLLVQHGIKRAMNVILQGDGKPFGVLEVDSKSEAEFLEFDLAFLQGAANILGMAIERERHEKYLTAALARQKFLMKEMNHRVKNSLAMVASMLNLQARDNTNEELTGHLNEAGNRIAAIAKFYDRLNHGADVERMDIGQYIGAICKDLDATVDRCEIVIDVANGIVVPTDRAISIALIVNELVTNAAKYAYPEDTGGRVTIKVWRDNPSSFSISVRDDGIGLGPIFDTQKVQGLGMRLVKVFVQQLNAKLSIHSNDPGTEFVIVVPTDAAQA